MKIINPVQILSLLPRTAVWLLGLSIALYQTAAIAEVYKCTDAKGQLSFSQIPCPTDSQSVTIELKGEVPVSPKQPPFNPEDYCQVVFEADYTGKDDSAFEGKTLRVKKGEKMLAGGFGGYVGEPDILFYLTDVGIIEYRLKAGSENKTPPPHHFTCQSTEVLKNGGKMIKTMAHTKMLVVLHDVNMYADEGLKQFACRLTAGTTLEKGSSTGHGTSPADKTEDNVSEYSMGRLEMDTLPDICNGHSSGNFKLKKTPAGAVLPFALVLWKLKK